jgi:hypothetical protein
MQFERKGDAAHKQRVQWRQLKYRWRRCITWTKETIDAELADLLARV